MFNLIGGTGHILGPLLGAIILTGVNEFLFAIGYYKMIVYGLIIILVFRLLPGGLISIPSIVKAIIHKFEKEKGVDVTQGRIT
jgi:branched-chain amino acid transport system permease protein